MSLASFFGELAAQQLFVVYELRPRTDGRVGTDKIPVDPYNGLRQIDCHVPANRLTLAEAELLVPAGGRHGVGYVLTEDASTFFLDLDHCRTPTGWADYVAPVLASFSGAFVECSSSGDGIHVLGRYSSPRPLHRTRCPELRLELYSAGRFAALTGAHASGSVLTDHTAALAALITERFPDRGDDGEAEWTDGPVPEWRGPADDEALIALGQRVLAGAATVFGGKASFADLYTGNVDKLAVAFPPQTAGNAYDGSGADLAFCNYAMWLTGNDCERTARLLKASGLARPKHDRPDYLRSTVLRAWQRSVFVERTAPSVLASPNAAPDATQYVDGLRVDRSDQGNGNLLVALAAGTLRYVAETKQWLYWNKNRWQIDTHSVFVNGRALAVAEHYAEQARTLENYGEREDAAKWAAKCRGRNALDAMVTQARKVEGVPISVPELDRNAWLLGVENGVVDLRTGELRPDARDELVTKRCPLGYDPTATAPRWEQFIAEITGAPHGHSYVPRPALARYLQKALGYSVTGSTKEQKFFLAIGAGSNGKNVVFDAVKRSLGDYARVLSADALMASERAVDAERPTSTAASLAGARFVLASETKDGQTLDVGALKNHTGDEEMTARELYQKKFTFKITHKLWLMTNNRPALDHVDAAVRGRVHLIPFDRRWNRPGEFEPDPALPNGDKELAATLAQEAAGILTWLVQGALIYQREGLEPPAEVVALTREYVQEQDHLGGWLATLRRCDVAHGSLASELFMAFQGWCAVEGVMPKERTQKAFSTALVRRGVEKQVVGRGTVYGIAR